MAKRTPSPEIMAFLDRAKAHAERAGLKLSTLSRHLFNDGKRLNALAEGARLWPERLAQAERDLARMEGQLEARQRTAEAGVAGEAA